MNSKIKEDLDSALLLIQNNGFCGKNFFQNKLYSFSTENLDGYLPLLNLKNKSILTVGSSGDQVLNCILLGAKEITLYDINIFAKYYFNLKRAAILALEHCEFLDFFIYNKTSIKKNFEVFNKTVFNKISKHLDDESFIFWDTLFKKDTPLNIKYYLFSIENEDTQHTIININSYLKNQSNYKKLKSIIKNFKINFINDDITNYSNHLSLKYDFINLSNIAQYLREIFKINHLEKFELLINDLTNNYLNTNGNIVLSYLYEYDDCYDLNYYEIYDLKKVYKTFNNYNIVLQNFSSITSIYRQCESNLFDGILLTTKN